MKSPANRIIPHSLPDRYTKRSLTPGDNNLKTHVMRIGKEAQTVTENLSLALKALRYPDKKRTLWVDALCINQDNIFDRNQQVQSMRHIYARASCVLIWLGEETDTVAEVFEMIKLCDECYKADDLYDVQAVILQPSTSSKWQAVSTY